MKTVLTRSVVRPTDDYKHRKKRIHFKDEVESKIIKNNNMHENFKHSKPLKPAEKDEEADKGTDSEDDKNEIRVQSCWSFTHQDSHKMAKKKEL